MGGSTLQVAYIVTSPAKGICSEKSREIFNLEFLPLCLSHSSFIEPIDNLKLYLGFESLDPIAPLKILLEAAVPKTTNKLSIAVSSSKLISELVLKAFNKQKASIKKAYQKGILKVITNPKGMIFQVLEGKEEEFLADLPLSLLPLKEKEILQLFLLGVKTFAELKDIPLSALVQKFGQKGYLWHEYSKGKDYSPIISLYPEDQVTYRQNFSYELTNLLSLEDVVKRTATFLAEKLEQKTKGCLTLKLQITETIHGSFYLERNFSNPTFNKDTLTTNLMLMLKDLKLINPLLSIEVRATNLKTCTYYQLNIFSERDMHEKKVISQLDKTIASFKKHYNPSIISFGKDLNLNRREEVLKNWDPLR